MQALIDIELVVRILCLSHFEILAVKCLYDSCDGLGFGHQKLRIGTIMGTKRGVFCERVRTGFVAQTHVSEQL